jgi:hypothetical protein
MDGEYYYGFGSHIMGKVDWIHLALNGDDGRAVVNADMNMRGNC